MDLSYLRTFLTIAAEESVTQAARRLHLTQPAVSTQLSRLEEEIGQPLFDRTPRGMILTEAGATFARFVEDALERLEAGQVAVDELVGLQRGSLTIGGGATATTYLLPPVLGRFHEEYPQIRFFVREQSSRQSVQDVLSGDLDLAIVTLPLQPTARRGSAAERLEVLPWATDELRLIVPPGHPLDGQPSFDWPDLDGQPLVLFEAGSAVREIIDERIASAGVAVDIVMELRAIEPIKQMVAQGIGAGFVSQFALARHDEGLRCVRDPIGREMAAIYRRDRTPSPAAQAFLRLLGAA